MSKFPASTSPKSSRGTVGCWLSRTKGSHHIFTMAGRRERLVIPVHGNHPLKVGLLHALMKLAELEESDL